LASVTVKYRTESIPTDDVVLVITGWGGNVTTCSRRSIARLSRRSDERNHDGQAGRRACGCSGRAARLHPARLGMMRMVRAAMISTSAATTMRAIKPASVLSLRLLSNRAVAASDLDDVHAGPLFG
jgi:hypothetical protein